MGRGTPEDQEQHSDLHNLLLPNPQAINDLPFAQPIKDSHRRNNQENIGSTQQTIIVTPTENWQIHRVTESSQQIVSPTFNPDPDESTSFLEKSTLAAEVSHRFLKKAAES